MAEQIAQVESLGGVAVGSEGAVAPEVLETLAGGIHGVVWWGSDARAYEQALAARSGRSCSRLPGR